MPPSKLFSTKLLTGCRAYSYPVPPRTSSTSRVMSSHQPPLKLPNNLKEEKLSKHPAYKTWLATLQQSLDLQQNASHPFHKSPYQLHGIEIQSCDYFGGGRLGFIKLKADVSNDQNEKLPAIVFLRGGSVAMLLILRPEQSTDPGEEYVILTVQPRIAAGSLEFVEIPAGMIDDSGTFEGAAAKEIMEETGLDIREDELIDMTKLSLECSNDEQAGGEAHLQHAMYPSAGGCDEFIPILLARKVMSRADIENMKGKLTGLRDHGEKITLRLCRLQDLWKIGARDAKTLAAVALYEGLKREGKI